MLRSGRQKRPIVIELSDSEDDVTPGKRTRNRSQSPEIKRGRGRRHPPAKDKTTTSPKTPTENQPQNSQVERIIDLESTDNAPITGGSSTGRNSFWERRKVWSIPELLAETQNIDTQAANRIVQLFENENTIPFICRYRRDLVSHLTPERLRDIKNTYSELVGLRKRAETIITQIEKNHNVDNEIRTELLCAKNTEELEFLYAPYKPASKGSLADRAKALGLDKYADHILFGDNPPLRLESIVQLNNPDLNTVEKVSTGICHIISHTISKHTSVLEELRRLQKTQRIMLNSNATKTSASTSKTTAAKTNNNNNKHNNSDQSKFENYFNYQADVRYLKPHQVLAINRGEKLKCLSVRLNVPDYLKFEMKRFVETLFLSSGNIYPLRRQIFEKSFEECYSKKLQPLLTRQIRADLNEKAKCAAIDVFAKNLKQLLLMSPLKGERILGIDPGFTNGCKLALISETADVLETNVIYPHTRNTDPEECGEQLAKLLARHKCKVIALGNGTACRETEHWLSKLFELGILDARTVRYSIVSEQGASVYSCGEVARKEFPDMDVNEISAVSIARRLNDPLSEYVKIEPRHIGVGMYQHDINEKTLTESLNEIVSECVSYVGVDLNTASLSVLKHVAGLTEKKAEKILEHRAKNGPFHTRKKLLDVKSIGEKTYVQCAGFVRIEPRSVGGKLENWLDCTWVHPECYDVAKKIITKCGLQLKNIGQDAFIAKIKDFVQRSSLKDLSAQFKMPEERLEVVLVALQRTLNQDYRSDFDLKPIFKHGIIKLSELSLGDVVTGAVTNVTHFGAFVDIGVEHDGLIHTSKMGDTVLSIGDRVTASIVQLDIKRRRVGLQLEQMIQQTDTSFTLSSQ